jgi:hypothetical protein
MDLTKIKSAVLNQLNNTNGLYSLKIQNHIYGCFIVMEDIAQNIVDLSDSIITTPKYTFDLDKQFSDIGLRYGFAMDSKLALDTFNPEYKQAWLEYFKDINIVCDINESDKIEDAIIEIIQTTIKSEDSFFIKALDTGSLPQEWIEKVLSLINYTAVTTSANETDETDNDNKRLLIKAKSEKPIGIRSRLANTRRSKVTIVNKKPLAKTRRHH